MSSFRFKVHDTINRFKFRFNYRSRILAYLASAESDLTLKPLEKTSLAIVIPVFSHEAFLPEMFHSVVKQTRRPDEVIIVNDCSPDNSDLLIKEFMLKPEYKELNIRYLQNEKNLGQTSSLNRAVKESSSELIMVLNDDDYLMHDAVEAACFLMKEHRVALLGSTSISFAGTSVLESSGKLIKKQCAYNDIHLQFFNPSDLPNYKHMNAINMTHSAMVLRREAFDQVGGYKVDKSQRLVPYSDRDLQLRINAHFQIATNNQVAFAFWRNDSSVDEGVNS